MSTSAPADTATAPAPRTPLWEDFVDIFTSPASVFRRRLSGGAGKAFLVFLALIGALGFASTRVLAPAQMADSRRVMERVAANNPEMQQAMQQRGSRPPNPVLGAVATVATYAVITVVVAIFTWLIAKIFGATATIGVAFMIVVYAQFPRILQQLATVLQGLLMDPSQLTSMFRVSTSPARFANPDTSSLVMLTALSRLDPFLLWSTALIAVGLYVVGGLSKLEAAAVAILMWILGTLPWLLPSLIF